MRPSPSLLTPILRSDTQGRLLALLLNDADREYSVSDLAARCGVAHPTVLREVDRLVAGGYLLERRVGRSRLLRPNIEHALYAPLRAIVLHGFGPAAVLPDLLRAVPGTEEAFIYGSWAARYEGEAGPEPGDVDVLVVGRPDVALLHRAGRLATEAVGREVSVRAVSREYWERGDDGFLRIVRSRPLVPILLRS